MTDSLNALTHYLQHLPVYSLLHSGMPEVTIHSFLREQVQFSGNLDPALLNLYKWHNGTREAEIRRHTLSELWLFPTMTFLSLEYGWELSQAYIKEETLDSDCLIIFSSLGGESLALRLSDFSSKHESPIYFISPQYPEPWHNTIIYDSIQKMIDTFLECLKTGCFYYDSHEMRLRRNIDLQFVISKKLNPISNYWRDE